MKQFSIKNHVNQKSLQQVPQKTHKATANLQNIQFVIIYHYTHTMKIIFITHKS